MALSGTRRATRRRLARQTANEGEHVRRLRRAAGPAALAGLIVGTVLLTLLPSAAGPAAHPAAAGTAAGTAASPAAPVTSGSTSVSPFADPAPTPDIVLIGVPGLRWADIQGEIPTPGLWLMARDSALAALSVRTAEATACPLDGWLTLNSGARSVGPRPGGQCAAVPVPRPEGAGTVVPDWAALVASNADYSYDPTWGTLVGARPGADPGTDDLRCAVGPGAAVALADGEGRVRATYAETLGALPVDACDDLLVVDPGALPLGPDRIDKLRTVDTLVRDLRAALPGSAVMVAGIADSDPDRAHLSAVMVEPGDRRLQSLRRGWLRAESTRRTGIVTITDLTPTLMPAPVPEDLDGTVLQSRARIESTPAAVRELDRRDVAAQVVRDMFVPFFLLLIAGQVLLYGAAGLALRRRRLGRRRCARMLTWVGLSFGAAPAATVLANLLPWRAAGHPAPALWGLILAISAVITLTAALGPWRRHPYGSAGTVGAITALVFALDVINGSRLELNGVFGLSPLIAGRFYGFGNIAFAVFAMCTLVAAAWVGAELCRRGRPGLAGAAIAVIGAVAVLIDGWPDFGADFGGVLALVPGVAVLAAGVAGIRVTPLRILALAAITVATVSAIALADWSRPAGDRSHLGRFVQDVVDGEGPGVVSRKADANLGLFLDAPIIVLAAAPLLVLVLIALFRPATLRLHAFAAAQAADPVLRPLLLGCLCTALIGFAVNDSGVIVPAVALITAAPLAIAIWANIWARSRPTSA